VAVVLCIMAHGWWGKATPSDAATPS